MRFFDGLVVLAIGALAYKVYRLTGITMATETKAQALLREVGETVASNSTTLESTNTLLGKMTDLLTRVQQGQDNGDTIPSAEIDSAIAELQSVQDANTEAKTRNDAAVEAIDAVLNAPATGGDTGTGSTGGDAGTGGDVGGV